MSTPVSPPRRLVILGPPGAGKGTQAKRLSQKLGVVHLSTGAMLRRAMDAGTELGRLAQPFVEAGELVPDDVMLGVVEHALQAPEVVEQGFLLDGFPRTAEQAEAFVSASPGRLDAVVHLTLEPGEARRRLLARGRGDDRPEVVDHRLAVDAEESGPLLAFLRDAGLVVEIDGGGSEDEVAERILIALSRRWDNGLARES
jgi:adenylate kinase